MKKLLMIPLLLMLIACSSTKAPRETFEDKYQFEETDMKNWEETVSFLVKEEAEIEDWHGGDKAINYLRRRGIIKEKEYKFLTSLAEKEEISTEDKKKFKKAMKKYVKKLPRDYDLRDTNIKDPKGLVKKMSTEALGMRIDNPSKHILTNVATARERVRIEKWAEASEMSNKDVKKLRKLLNKFMNRKEFFDAKSWQNREISGRMEKLVELSKKSNLSKDLDDTVRAKAMFIAYHEYFSELDKWK